MNQTLRIPIHLKVNWKSNLTDNGYILLTGIAPDDIHSILGELGNIIHENRVEATLNTKSLTNSYRALDFHTDHHKADYTCLYCINQSKIGGESRLVDMREILKEFTSKEKEMMKSIFLREHKVFPNDPEIFPLLSNNGNEDEFYYSYWLVKDNLSYPQSRIINKLKNKIEKQNPIQFKMCNSDLLIINNKRMLHARTSIGLNESRILHRFWLEKRRTL